jgi:hypothetical protein
LAILKRLAGRLKKLTGILSQSLLPVCAIVLVALPALLLQKLVPEYLESETVAVVLKTIIDVCGVLIGFTGILATIQLSHAEHREVMQRTLDRLAWRKGHKGTLNAAGLTLASFFLSILVGLAGLMFTTPKTFLSTWPV